jgi:hypothetical protein
VEQYWRANAPDVISETIDGETIILHLGNGFYFSAGGAGALVWRLLSQSVSVTDTVSHLSQAYDVSGEDVPGVVAEFTEQLAAEGLLVPAGAAGAIPQAVTESSAPWVAPTLAKFTDMEDLLLLDPVHEVSPQQGWPYVAANGGAA